MSKIAAGLVEEPLGLSRAKGGEKVSYAWAA
jgi:hypothetical protein